MKQAIILAAGEGRRLRPFTVTRPKSMLSIADRPIIQYVIEALAKNGIRDIILVVGYQQEQISGYIGDGGRFGVEVRYVTQEKQLGTAHAVLQARSIADSEFLVLQGNKVISPDTIAAFINVQPNAILVKNVPDPSRYGVVTVTDGRLKEIVEKPNNPHSQIISAGIYAFNTEAFRYLEAQLTIPDALMMMLRNGLGINTVETTGMWADVVYPWDLLSLNGIMLRDIAQEYAGTIEQNVAIKGSVTIGKDTIIRQGTYISGPVVIGEGCDIGPDVCIFPATSIGSNVVISPFSEIKNAVIEDDVHIGTGSIVQDSVIDKGCVVGPRFCASAEETEVRIDDEQHMVRMGIVMGEGCSISSNVTVQPGTIVGNYCQVKSQRLVGGGVIPDRSILI